MKVCVEISDRESALLRVLDEEGDIEGVLLELIDHAQQGVYRPGAWEREWICQAFGYDWTEKLEPDPKHPAIFQRPKSA